MKLQHRRKQTRPSLPLERRRPPIILFVIPVLLIGALSFLYMKEIPAPQAAVEKQLDASKFIKE